MHLGMRRQLSSSKLFLFCSRGLFLTSLLALFGFAAAFAVDTQASLPPGYKVLRQLGKPCRISLADLPWKLRDGDTRYSKVTRHAVEAWNSEGRRLGVGPFFQLVSEGEDLLLDWSGAGLPADKAGGVFWDSNLGYRRAKSLAMDGGHRVPDGNRAEILMQELGHLLGLGDSVDPSDIMYPVMHTRRAYRLSSAALTERDRQSLSWLYAQSEWIPILKPKQPFRRPAVTPNPGFTPLPLEPTPQE